MHRYVSLMCDVKSEEQYYQQQDVVVLFSESTLRYVHTHTYKSQNSQNHSIVNMQAKRKPQVSIFVQLTLLQGNPSLDYIGIAHCKHREEFMSYFKEFTL